MKIELGGNIRSAVKFTRRNAAEIVLISCTIGAGSTAYGAIDWMEQNRLATQAVNRSLQDVGLSREGYYDSRLTVTSIPKQVDRALREGKNGEEVKQIIDSPDNKKAIDIFSQGSSIERAIYASGDTERAKRNILLMLGGVIETMVAGIAGLRLWHNRPRQTLNR